MKLSWLSTVFAIGCVLVLPPPRVSFHPLHYITSDSQTSWLISCMTESRIHFIHYIVNYIVQLWDFNLASYLCVFLYYTEAYIVCYIVYKIWSCFPTHLYSWVVANYFNLLSVCLLNRHKDWTTWHHLNDYTLLANICLSAVVHTLQYLSCYRTRSDMSFTCVAASASPAIMSRIQ